MLYYLDITLPLIIMAFINYFLPQKLEPLNFPKESICTKYDNEQHITIEEKQIKMRYILRFTANKFKALTIYILLSKIPYQPFSRQCLWLEQLLLFTFLESHSQKDLTWWSILYTSVKSLTFTCLPTIFSLAKKEGFCLFYLLLILS